MIKNLFTTRRNQYFYQNVNTFLKSQIKTNTEADLFINS